MKLYRFILLALLTNLLSACGQTGPLYLPAKDQPNQTQQQPDQSQIQPKTHVIKN